MAAGYHVVFWDGTDGERRRVANGIYLCRPATGLGTMLTRKITLVH
jgi:hypothetical protein